MDLEVVLGNVLAATGLALAAWITSHVLHRPALAHGLWVLVLLKLCTPPLFFVPLAVCELPPAVAGSSPEPAAASMGEAIAAAARFAEATGDEAAAPPAAGGFDVLTALAAFAAAGSTLVALAFVRRSRRLAVLVCRSPLAPAPLLAELGQLCRRFGIARAPELRSVPGNVPPMLWATPRRARILLPSALCERLSAAEVRSLLAHELAHLKRRDHWVRWLELFCRCLFWWNPLVFWAARELRLAEEECCDAWVVWALPGGSRPYAGALVKTVEFLSAAAGALPVAATGMGPVQNLNRRLTMIMKPMTPRSLSRLARLFVFATAVAALPTLPVLAQEGEQPGQARLERFLEQNREHPDAVRAVLKDHIAKLEAMKRAGDLEEAEEAARSVDLLKRWLGERERRQEPRQQDPGREALLEALKKAVHALRERDDARSAEIVAQLAEQIAAERRQRAENDWRRDYELLKKAQEQAAERDAQLRRGWKYVESEQRGNEQAELIQMVKSHEERVERLAEQVERLAKVVERLHSRFEDETPRERAK